MVETGGYRARSSASTRSRRPTGGCSRRCTASSCASTSCATTSCASRSAAAAPSTSSRRSPCASTRSPLTSTSRRARRRRGRRAHCRARRLAVARPVPARRAPRRRLAGASRSAPTRTAATGRTRRSTTRGRCAARCRPDDAFYGLGEKSGRLNRRGRDFTLWNTDVLDPHATGEFTAGREPTTRGPTRRAPSSTRTTSRSRSSTTRRIRAGAMAGFVRRQRLSRRLRLLAPRASTRIHFAGGQYTEYVFAGPAMPAILEAYTWLTGRIAPPPLWALGYHQCRWFDYTQDAVEALGARHRERGHPVRRAVARHRLHGRLPRLHLEHRGLPGRRRRCSSGCASRASASITIVDPGVKHEPGYAVFDEALERDVLVPDRGRRHLHRPGLAGQHGVPRLRHARRRARGGASSTPRTCESGLAGIWNDMNEPATGEIPPDAMRFDRGPRTRTSATTTSTRC